MDVYELNLAELIVGTTGDVSSASKTIRYLSINRAVWNRRRLIEIDSSWTCLSTEPSHADLLREICAMCVILIGLLGANKLLMSIRSYHSHSTINNNKICSNPRQPFFLRTQKRWFLSGAPSKTTTTTTQYWSDDAKSIVYTKCLMIRNTNHLSYFCHQSCLDEDVQNIYI